MSFGGRLKELRETKNILQRELAAKLEIDTPMYSKIERGERRAKREHVLVLADLLDSSKDELLSIWLADQIYDLIKEEKLALISLKIAEKLTKNHNQKSFK